MYAEMSMHNDLLKEAARKKALRPSQMLEMAMNAVTRRGVSIVLACRAFEISETCYRYSPLLRDENEEIADWLERLTANKRNWGFGLCFLYLRNVQGYDWNHKRVYQLYCEFELNLRIKPKKRLKRDKPEPLALLRGPMRPGRWILWQTSSLTVVRSGR